MVYIVMYEGLENLYNSIDEYAVKCLLWNYQTKGTLGFENFDYDMDDHLWFLNMGKHLSMICGIRLFYKGNFLEYLKLKYFKGFKYLLWYNKNKCNFLIDVTDFNIEITKAFEQDPYILMDIYECNYKEKR